MNNVKSVLLVFLLGMIQVSCGSGKAVTSKTFADDTANHKRIAIVPIQSKIKLKAKDKEKVSDADIRKIELVQSKDVQNAVESYLMSRNLRVTIQSASVTNSKLNQNKIDFARINDIDIIQLTKILGVDAVVTGEIETEKPMSDELARGLDVAKGLERSILGSGFLSTGVSTTTNKGWCSLSLFEGKNGDRLWTYKNDLEMGAGSNTNDIINKMMKDGAKKFLYKK